MWARGPEMIWMDSLIIDIGILSYPAAFPEAKDWVMVILNDGNIKRFIRLKDLLTMFTILWTKREREQDGERTC